MIQISDDIVKTETAGKDADSFSKLISKNWVGDLDGAYTENDSKGKSKGEVKQTNDSRKHEEDIKRYYVENVDEEIIRSVYERYKWDFKLFGYSLDGFIEKIVV